MFHLYRRSKCVDPAALEAVRSAKAGLDEVLKQGKEVRKVAEASRELRRRNHFAEDLQKLFAGGVG